MARRFGVGADPSTRVPWEGKPHPSDRDNIFLMPLQWLAFVLLSCCYAPEAPQGKSTLKRKQHWQKVTKSLFWLLSVS